MGAGKDAALDQLSSLGSIVFESSIVKGSVDQWLHHRLWHHSFHERTSIDLFRSMPAWNL